MPSKTVAVPGGPCEEVGIPDSLTLEELYDLGKALSPKLAESRKLAKAMKEAWEAESSTEVRLATKLHLISVEINRLLTNPKEEN